MDADSPSPHDPSRTIRTLSVAWASVGVVWVFVVVLALALKLWPVPPLVIAGYAAASLAAMVAVATRNGTRDLWADLRMDKSPEAYILWTILGATAAGFIAVEGWTLTAMGFFLWLPTWLCLLIFGLPAVAILVRLKDLNRRYLVPRRLRRHGTTPR